MHTRNFIVMSGLDAEYFNQSIAFGHDLISRSS